jgi:hypothetical protein
VGTDFWVFIILPIRGFDLTTKSNINRGEPENAVTSLGVFMDASRNAMNSIGLGCYNRMDKEPRSLELCRDAYLKPVSGVIADRKAIYRFLRNGIGDFSRIMPKSIAGWASSYGKGKLCVGQPLDRDLGLVGVSRMIAV